MRGARVHSSFRGRTSESRVLRFSPTDRLAGGTQKLRRAGANQSWALIGGFTEHLSTLPGGPRAEVCDRAALSGIGIAVARHLCSHTTITMAALTMSAAAVRPVVARASVARRCVSLARPARARSPIAVRPGKSRSRSAATGRGSRGVRLKRRSAPIARAATVHARRARSRWGEDPYPTARALARRVRLARRAARAVRRPPSQRRNVRHSTGGLPPAELSARATRAIVHPARDPDADPDRPFPPSPQQLRPRGPGLQARPHLPCVSTSPPPPPTHTNNPPLSVFLGHRPARENRTASSIFGAIGETDPRLSSFSPSQLRQRQVRGPRGEGHQGSRHDHHRLRAPHRRGCRHRPRDRRGCRHLLRHHPRRPRHRLRAPARGGRRRGRGINDARRDRRGGVRAPGSGRGLRSRSSRETRNRSGRRPLARAASRFVGGIETNSY